MNIGIVFENCKSTESSPFGFFIEILKPGVIKKCLNEFYQTAIDNDKPVEYSYYNRIYYDTNFSFPFEIDKKNRTITIEFEEEVDFDELTGPVYEWREKVFQFDLLLSTLFENKYLESIMIFKLKLEPLTTKRKKEIIGDCIKSILSTIKCIESENEVLEIKTLILTYCKRIVKYFYSEFEKFCPDPNTQSLIIDILQESSTELDFFKKPQLCKSIVPYLCKFSKLKNKKITSYPNDPDLIIAWTSFLDGEFEKISNPICLTKPIQFSSFLLSELILTLNFNIAQLSKKGIFHIRDVKMIAALTITNRSKFRKKHSAIAQEIQDIISSYKC